MSSNICIEENPNYVTVIVQLTCEPGDQDKVIELSKENLPVFAKQKGFIGSVLHKSRDGKTIINYLQWKTAEDHFACMESPDFDGVGKEFMEMIQSGQVKFYVDIYDQVEITHPNLS